MSHPSSSQFVLVAYIPLLFRVSSLGPPSRRAYCFAAVKVEGRPFSSRVPVIEVGDLISALKAT